MNLTQFLKELIPKPDLGTFCVWVVGCWEGGEGGVEQMREPNVIVNFSDPPSSRLFLPPHLLPIKDIFKKAFE